jgi:HAD superfamily hydrolase (TIGR01509 family)
MSIKPKNTLAAIILDFDGLILDTETPLYVSWQEVCEAHSVPMDHAWWATLLTAKADPPEAYALLEERSSRPFDMELVRKARSARELQLIAGQSLLPGVAELISQAKALSMHVGIASNSERAWVTGHLSRLGLLDAIDQIKCCDDVQHPKPSPDPYLAVLDALSVSAGEAIAFEDSPAGVAAAKAAGVFCVAVPNAVTRTLDFPGVDLVLPSLAGVSLMELVHSFGIDVGNGNSED